MEIVFKFLIVLSLAIHTTGNLFAAACGGKEPCRSKRKSLDCTGAANPYTPSPKRVRLDFVSPEEMEITPQRRSARIASLTPQSMGCLTAASRAARKRAKQISGLAADFRQQAVGRIGIPSDVALKFTRKGAERLLNLVERVARCEVDRVKEGAAKRNAIGEESFVDKADEYNTVDHTISYTLLLKVLMDPGTRCYKRSSGHEELNLVRPVNYTYTDEYGNEHTYPKILVMGLGVNEDFSQLEDGSRLYSVVFHACHQDAFPRGEMHLVDARVCIVSIADKMTLALVETIAGVEPLPAEVGDGAAAASLSTIAEEVVE